MNYQLINQTKTDLTAARSSSIGRIRFRLRRHRTLRRQDFNRRRRRCWRNAERRSGRRLTLVDELKPRQSSRRRLDGSGRNGKRAARLDGTTQIDHARTLARGRSTFRVFGVLLRSLGDHH